MLTQAIRLELGTLGVTNSMQLTQLELSSLLIPPSYIKLHLAIALKRKSGDPLSGASWLNTLNAKGSPHMHIMHNIWLTLFPMENWMEVASGRGTKPIGFTSGIAHYSNLEKQLGQYLCYLTLVNREKLLV